MGKSSAPDPYATSDAQAAANTNAVKTAAKISAVDQNAPWGSTTYTRDAEGVPTEQKITLGAPEQTNYDTTINTKNQLAANAGTLAGGLPTTPFTMPDQARADTVQNTLYNRKMAMLQPQFDEANNSVKTTLAERGIPIGSEIYNREMDRASRNQNEAMTAAAQDATLAGGQESDRLLNQAITLRGQPYNELSALLSGAAGVQMPQFQASPAFNVQAPNVSDLVYKSAQANQQGSNSLLNGLFGLGAAAMPFLSSDRRVKKDIRRIGTTDAGLPVYTYRYITGGPTLMGIMADEAETKFPNAVIEVNGLKMVNYAEIG